MTLDDIRAMKDDFITPATAAKVMKMDPGRLIQYARSGQLPFKAVISGNRVKIPRKAFLAACGADEPEKPDPLEMINVQLRAITMLMVAIAAKVNPKLADLVTVDKEGLQ